MPKGDREMLKADIEDGYTKIANLLIEALSFSNLSSLRLRLTLYLIRRTYGWKQKSAYITLKEFAQAVNSKESRVSTEIKKLVEWRIWKRVDYQPGRTPAYTVNTRVNEWDKGSLNSEGFTKWLSEGFTKWGREPFTKRLTPDASETSQDAPSSRPKENIKKNKRNNILSLTGEGHSPPAASQGQENTPPNNQQLIAELVRKYRETGAKSQKGDYPFIGRLYNEFGYDRVLMGINALGYKLAAGFHPDDPLIYLGGIVRKEDKPDAKIRGDPYQNQKAGQADQYAKYNALFKTQRNSCRA